VISGRLYPRQQNLCCLVRFDRWIFEEEPEDEQREFEESEVSHTVSSKEKPTTPEEEKRNTKQSTTPSSRCKTNPPLVKTEKMRRNHEDEEKSERVREHRRRCLSRAPNTKIENSLFRTLQPSSFSSCSSFHETNQKRKLQHCQRREE